MNKKDNKIEDKKGIKKENIMDYKATEFFNNLNKAKPVIIKESKGNIEDKSLLGMFLKSNESNENPNSNKDIPNTNQININEEYSESKIEIPNLNDLINDFDAEKEGNIIEKKEEEKIEEEEKEKEKEEEEKEEEEEDNKIEKNVIQQKEDITEGKEDEDIIYDDKNNKNKQILNINEKYDNYDNRNILSKSIDDIELINKKIINKYFEKIVYNDNLSKSIDKNKFMRNINLENDEIDGEVNINNNLSDNDFDNEEEDEILNDINENKIEIKLNKEEEKEKILKTIEELKIKLKTLIGENDYNTFIIN